MEYGAICVFVNLFVVGKDHRALPRIAQTVTYGLGSDGWDSNSPAIYILGGDVQGMPIRRLSKTQGSLLLGNRLQFLSYHLS